MLTVNHERRRLFRETRTPEMDARQVLKMMRRYYKDVVPENGDHDFTRDVVEMMKDDPHLSAEDYCDRWSAHEASERANDYQSPYEVSLHLVLLTACAYAYQGWREYRRRDGSLNLAWTYIADAHAWAGEVMGTVLGMAAEQDVWLKEAAAGADKRHAENRAMRKQVETWCETNLNEEMSIDGAAGMVAGKLVPITFRTARNWISQWRRQLQSPGTT